MGEQLSFPGFGGGARARRDRVFFAVLPEPDAAAGIARLASDLRAEHGLQRTPQKVSRLHVSLAHIGDFAGLPDGIVDKAMTAAADVAAPAFDVAFDRVKSFPGKRGNQPLVLFAGERLAALASFRQALCAALAGAGLYPSVAGRFAPHVTLLYDGQAVAERAVEPIGWRVREFVLVHSLHGLGEYRLLGRWRLQG